MFKLIIYCTYSDGTLYSTGLFKNIIDKKTGIVPQLFSGYCRRSQFRIHQASKIIRSLLLVSFVWKLLDACMACKNAAKAQLFKCDFNSKICMGFCSRSAVP
jgi:hypothetical protein